ncbi:MAG TPA: ABC transporter permease [Janthinobacterium sp.]|nr:ABC transporter permease [Janthinobacterium sp.]
MNPASSLPALLALLVCGAATANPADCGVYVRTNPGGDYTNPEDRQGLGVVEQYHFTKNVENLVRGASGSVGDDLHYTLSHFPNHHRALLAMARLALRQKTSRPSGAAYTVDCYFERALRFAPADTTLRSIYGSYLLAGGQSEAALAQLREAVRRDPNNATVNYNLGLMYAKKKDYTQALAYAQKAYALGFGLPGLKNKLIAAGRWQEPPAPESPAPVPTAVPPVPETPPVQEAAPAG